MKNVLFVTMILFAFACKKNETTQADLCEGVICLNGGVCVNGDCNCAPGFEGPDCSLEKIPLSMTINSLTISKFPPLDGTAPWDFTSGADPYIEIYEGSTLVWTSNPVSDVAAAPVYIVGSVTLNNPEYTHTMRVLDYDGVGLTPDLMGDIEFKPYVTGGLFPTKYTLYGINLEVKCEVTYAH